MFYVGLDIQSKRISLGMLSGRGGLSAARVNGSNRIISHGAPQPRMMPNGCPAGTAGDDLKSAQHVPRQDRRERRITEKAQNREDALPDQTVVDGREPPGPRPRQGGQTLNERGIQKQLADLDQGKSRPDLGGKTKPVLGIEEPLARDVDQEQAGNGQELSPPGGAKLQRHPDSEGGGEPAVHQERDDQEGNREYIDRSRDRAGNGQKDGQLGEPAPVQGPPAAWRR